MNEGWMLLVKASYFVAAVLFIVSLKRMSKPATARGGIVWAGAGMLVAVIATFFLPGVGHRLVIIVALVLAGALAWWSGRRVAMTAMPQMVAMYNGLGGGAAAAIGAVELIIAARLATLADTSPLALENWGRAHQDLLHHDLGTAGITLAVIGALIGAVSFTGSLIAFGKLQGWIDRRYVFRGQHLFNTLVLIAAVLLGVLLVAGWTNLGVIALFFIAALAFGVLMTLPIGGADMPVVISFFNALTGLAVGFEGFVLQNEAMIIAGTMVGAAGTLLTQLMARAMNRSLANVLFGNFGAGAAQGESVSGEMKPTDAADAAVMMAWAERVVIVPGYGMAVAQAQHKVWELAKTLIDRGVQVRFAIHPVAGRMPGHMNVLLAEAGVPYDLIVDMDDINPEFATTDVTLVIGANDVVNPVAKTDPSSPIHGMPILDVADSKNVLVIKRGRGKGFAGIENALFYADNTRMLFGDGQAMAGELVSELKNLDD